MRRKKRHVEKEFTEGKEEDTKGRNGCKKEKGEMKGRKEWGRDDGERGLEAVKGRRNTLW